MKKEILETFIADSIQDKTQFNICHELRGHCLAEHVTDLYSLQAKLWDMPKATDANPIVAATRFFSEDEALNFIYIALMQNIDAIIKWRKNLYQNFLTIESEFDMPVGEGIIKLADKNQLIPMHKITIVLSNGDNYGQPFYIKTAYPSRTFDDNDACYDAIDAFQAKKKLRKR